MRAALCGLAALIVLSAGGTALAQQEPRFSFRDTPGALSKDAVPLHVALDLEPRFEPDGSAARFDAEVRIRWRADKPMPVLELHALDLQFDAAWLDGAVLPAPAVDPKFQRVRFDVPGGIQPGERELRVRYRGLIGKSPTGLHVISTPTPEGIRHVLATLMEPIGARRLLPLWDEPVFRVPFELRVVVPAGLAAISNGEVVKREPLPPVTVDGPARERVSFAATPAMPSYLLALFIGRFDSIEDNTEAPLLRIHTMPGRSAQGRLALQATRQLMREYADYFAQPYPLPKLDQIALPGGFPGAMENWGAISYNESILLYDPATSPADRRLTVWNILAHEVAHQWFGNLVTMAWWDNLWLNEGFATWMQQRAAQRLNPDDPVWLRGAKWVDEAMETDSSASALPVWRRIDDDRAVFASFDEITYSKGQAFIRMLESWVGETAFRDGLRRYMAAHKMGNTTTADLWHHLEAASGKPIARIADAWVRRSGLPLVGVRSHCDHGRLKVALTQRRFSFDPNAEARLWPIPLTLARYDTSGRLLERRSVFLQGTRAVETLAGCSGALKANIEGSGYYRVKYSAADTTALRRVYPRLPAGERLNLLADTWAQVLAGQTPADEWLRLVEGITATVGRHADTATFEQLRRLARHEPLADRRQLLWSAIGAARDAALAPQTIVIARTDEAPAEQSPWLLAAVAGAGHRDLAWQALQQYPEIRRRMSPQGALYLAPSVLRGSGDAAVAAELLRWTEREFGAPAMPEAQKAADVIGINARLVRDALPQVARWALEPR